MMYYRIYNREWGKMVAACDIDICDKTFKEGDIEFFVNPRFYKDKEADKEEMIDILKGAAGANLAGKEAVECGVESGLINSKNILKIEGILHAQAIVMNI